MKASLFRVDLTQDDLYTKIGAVKMDAEPAIGSVLKLEGEIAEEAHERGYATTFQVSQVTHLVGYKHALNIFLVDMP